MQILVFGDSIAYGSWDLKESGWAGRLRKFIDQKLMNDDFYCIVYNLAIDGNDTKSLLKRLDFEIQQRLTEDETLIIFALGGKDTVLNDTTQKVFTTPEEFRENINMMLSIALKYTKKIVYVGLVPNDDSKTHPIEWMPEYSYGNEYRKKYNQIIKEVCKANNVHFIDIFSRLEKLDYKSLLYDGVHPNDKGHRKIFSIIKSYLVRKELLKI